MGRVIPFQRRSVLRICPVCGAAHVPGQMHDYLSATYIEGFYAENGRMPTPRDAMAHCSPEVQQYWTIKFRKYGIEV